MNKLILAVALAPALLVTGAQAQTVSEDVVKQLWCGVAFTTYFGTQKANVPPDKMAGFQTLLDAASKLTDQGVQGYLNGGFTEEQVAKIKTDLVAEVTPAVTGQKPGKYSGDECGVLFEPLLPASSAEPPADTSSAAPPDMSSSAPPADMSSSAPAADMSSAAPASSSAQ